MGEWSHIYYIYLSPIPGLFSLYESDIDEYGNDWGDFEEHSRWVKEDISKEECLILIDLRGGKIVVGNDIITTEEYRDKYLD